MANFCRSAGCEFVLKLKAINFRLLILCLALFPHFAVQWSNWAQYFSTTVTYKPPILQIPDIAIGENVLIWTTT
jgi:hypothetical protein